MLVDSPVGPLCLEASPAGLAAVRFGGDDRRAQRGAVLAQAAEEIAEYFAGLRRVFDVPLDWAVATPFQARVLRALVEVAYGQTCGYGEVAVAIGQPGAAPAAGGALARNPLPVVLPCHRVVTASGALAGYGGADARGGRTDIKRALLAIEQAAA